MRQPRHAGVAQFPVRLVDPLRGEKPNFSYTCCRDFDPDLRMPMEQDLNQQILVWAAAAFSDFAD